MSSTCKREVGAVFAVAHLYLRRRDDFRWAGSLLRMIQIARMVCIERSAFFCDVGQSRRRRKVSKLLTLHDPKTVLLSTAQPRAGLIHKSKRRHGEQALDQQDLDKNFSQKSHQPTSPTSFNPAPPAKCPSIQKREQIRMHHIQRPTRIPLLDDTADVDLARALRNHLDIDPVLAQRAEEPARNADHTP